MPKAAVIRVGSTVLWRGCFGRDLPRSVKVVGIERTEGPREKHGKEVQEIPFSKRRYGCFSLDNDNWCYGDQIDKVLVE